jgi:hypothetical protein
MGRADLVGNGKHHLIPTFQPLTDGSYQSARKKNSTPVGAAAGTAGAGKSAAKGVVVGLKGKQPVKGQVLTQHTGLPPRSPNLKPVKPNGGRTTRKTH